MLQLTRRVFPGWEKVDRLARALVGLKGLCITNQQAGMIQKLYQDMLEYDKRPVVFRPSTTINPPKGRFGRTKREAATSFGQHEEVY